MKLDPFFHAKKIAIIGASREIGKVGNVILKQLIGKDFELYPVNPHANKILGLEVSKSVSELPEGIELAVIATPASTVPGILDEMGKKKIRHAVIISAGFKETGNKKLERELKNAIDRNKITCVGPNCLGVFDAHTGLDTLFLPKERLRRPKPGKISFISQSGALGSAVMDLSAYENYGFAKFVSYGNAISVDESDLLSYLSKDPDTKVICLYIEGVKDGRKLIKAAKSCKKPIIVLKGGVSSAGGKATMSHTGSLAGEAEIYFGSFKQAGMIRADTLEEVFEFAKALERLNKPMRGKRVQIITNGGGYGILATDSTERYGLKLAKPGKPVKDLKQKMLETVVVGNPFDVLGDATNERYKLAIEASMKDKNNDAIVVVVLPQTPRIDQAIVQLLAHFGEEGGKPIVAVTTGSEYARKLKRELEDEGVPCFTFPDNAMRAISAYFKSMR